MKKMEQLKKKARDNKDAIFAYGGLALAISAYVGICVWERKHYTTVSRKDWEKLTGQSTFDELLDKEIVNAFATVEYADGTVGVIDNVIAVAEKIVEQAPKEV